MKNIVISIILFLALVFSLLFLNNKFINICEILEEKGNEIEILLDNEEIDLAYDKSIELLDFLSEQSTIPSIYLNHTDYDNLINECIKICVYIKHKDISQAQASVHVVVFSSNDLKEIHKINIKNIF